MKIVSKVRRFKFDIELKSKYTIIRGKSAIGKSIIAKLLCSRSDTYVVSDSRYTVLDLSSIVSNGQSLRKPVSGRYIFIIDDDDAECSAQFEHLVRITTNSYYIIISRNTRIPYLNYSADDIYTLARIGDTATLVPYGSIEQE